MRKPDAAKKGAPRGKPFPKKEKPLEQQTQPAGAPESGDETLAEAVRRQVEAKFAKMDAAATEPSTEPAPAPQTASIDRQILAAIPEVPERPRELSPKAEMERALLGVAEEQRQQKAAPRTGEMPLPARKKNETTQQYTERLVDTMIAAQMRRRQQVLEARRLKQPIHNIPPVQVFTPTRRDDAAPPAGAKLNDGWWRTWVSTKDMQDKPDPSLMKVQEMRAWDYEVVTDDAGKPVQNRLGVLMQGPPERRAARQAAATPIGSRRPQEDQFKQAVEDMNRDVGYTALVARDWSDRFGG